MICEICHERIEEPSCCLFDFGGRGIHKSCLRRTLRKSFFGIIGTRDDEIDDMLTEDIIDALTDYTPGEDGHIE